MSLYEIEIKSLLGSSERALKLKEKINQKGGVLKHKNNQLNHYFVVDDVTKLRDKLLPHIEQSKKSLFEKILKDGKNISVRTRDTDGKVLFVIKTSIGDDSSSNGVSRLEFESETDLTLEQLDEILLSAGLEYQAKWSRTREEYILGDTNICLDKNAGYGYLAEFEKIVTDQGLVDTVKKELHETMENFGVEELSQDRLERMFSYYNNNWRDYYGTEKIFNIE